MTFKHLSIRSFLLLLGCLLISSTVALQAQVIKPSVSGEIAKGGSHGVDIPTGTLNYSLPLLSIGKNGYTIPITLSYTGGRGIKVDDHEGRAGIGWQLGAGGFVSRTIRGRYPDDKNSESCAHYWLNRTPGDRDRSEDIHNRILDGESDIFNASFGGQSVSFIIRYNKDQKKYEPIPLKYTNLRIELFALLNNETQTDEIIAIQITDASGILYTFHDLEYTENAIVKEGNKIEPEILSRYISIWHLSTIQTPSNEGFTFRYAKVPAEIREAKSKLIYHYGKPLVEHARYVSLPSSENSYFSHVDMMELEDRHNTRIQQQLDKISSASQIVQFYGDTPERNQQRMDLEKGLSEIVKKGAEVIRDIEKQQELANSHQNEQSLQSRIDFLGLVTNYASVREILNIINPINHQYPHLNSPYLEWHQQYDKLIHTKEEETTTIAIYHPLILESIFSVNSEIIFEATSATPESFNLSSSNRLRSQKYTTITLKKNNVVFKVVHLHYSFTPHEPQLLKSVEFESVAEKRHYSYQFDYFHENKNPNFAEEHHRKDDFDLYGYYNNLARSGSYDDLMLTHLLYESTKPVIDYNKYNSIYSIDPDFIKTFSLKKVTLPYGGSVSFDYEPNSILISQDYPANYNFQQVLFAGIRIKEIKIDNGQGSIQSQTYKYLSAEGTSSGYIDPSAPITISETVTYQPYTSSAGFWGSPIRNDDYFNDRIEYWRRFQSDYTRFVGKSGNNGVWYSQVEVSTPNNGKEVYCYPKGSWLTTNIRNWVDVGDLLLHKMVYDESGKLQLAEKYTYNVSPNIFYTIDEASPLKKYLFKNSGGSSEWILNHAAYRFYRKYDEINEWVEGYKNTDIMIARYYNHGIVTNPCQENFLLNYIPRNNMLVPDNTYGIAVRQAISLHNRQIYTYSVSVVFSGNPYQFDVSSISTPAVKTEERYWYDIASLQMPTRVEKQESDGSITTQKIKYPASYQLPESHPISTLKQQNQIQVPIETQVWKTDEKGSRIVSASIQDFEIITQTTSGFFIAPIRTYQSTWNEPLLGGSTSFNETLDQTQEFTSVLHDDPSLWLQTMTYVYTHMGSCMKKYSDKSYTGIVNISYFDDYDNIDTEVTTTVENTKNFDFSLLSSTVGQKTQIMGIIKQNTYSSLTVKCTGIYKNGTQASHLFTIPAKKGALTLLRQELDYTKFPDYASLDHVRIDEILEYPWGSGQNKSNVIALCLIPKEGQYKKYIYDDYKVNLKYSFTNAGELYTYDYDEFNELKQIKDQNGDPIKTYNYAFAQSTTPTVYYNTPVCSGYITQCQLGEEGSYNSFCVTAGKFSSTISQADAQRKAKEYVNAGLNSQNGNDYCVGIMTFMNEITVNNGDFYSDNIDIEVWAKNCYTIELSSNAKWLSVPYRINTQRTNYYDQATFTVGFTPNTDDMSREAIITLKTSIGLINITKTITVYQKGINH